MICLQGTSSIIAKLWPALGLVTFLILERTTVTGNIQVVKRKETSIECSSNTDLTFTFFSNWSNDSLAIAECDFNRKSCMFLTTFHENIYTISYTGRGGILIIIDLDEQTAGTYECHETYNPMNFVSTMITKSVYNSSTENRFTDQTKKTEHRFSERPWHIVLGILKDQSIECSSNVDITFKFISNKLNIPVTIAECDLSKKSCIIFKPLLRKYNLSYTGSGGVLHINSLNNESCGTYICCETYNPNIFVSIDIISHIMDEADNTYNITVVAENNTDNHLDNGGTNNSSSILTIVFSSCAALFLIGIICVIIYERMKGHLNGDQTFLRAASNGTDNLEMVKPTEFYDATAPYPSEENENTSAPLLCSTIRRSSDSKLQLTKHANLAETTQYIESMPSVRAVAAIELGTTYSGCAFSFTQDPNNVVINTILVNGGSSNLIATKTPTIVLLDNKGEFHSFGFDAEKHFLSLANKNNHRGWRLFRRFRMALHKNCSLDTTIDDLEGNPYPAMEIFKHAIKYLHGHLFKAIQLASPTLLETNIQYIITVPAIWTAEAIHFMRESAIKAGINKEKLKLVVESAAVATWWTRLNIKDSPDIELQTPGSKWLVVKLGGGSTSVLAYEVLPEGTVNMIQQASGGAWGFTYVEQQFMNNLEKELGSGNLDNLRREHIGDYYELLHEIEEKTQSKYILSKDVCVVRLPYSLSPEGKHRIETAKIKAWFDSEISSCISHIKTVLNNSLNLRDITSMVVVGSFAESLYVQNMLREIFPQLKLIIPQNQSFAVLKGAVWYGHSTLGIYSN